MQRETQALRRRVARSLFVSGLGLALLLLTGLQILVDPGPVAATDQESSAANQVRILEVSGLLDPVLEDFVIRELDLAEQDGVLGFLLQFDSEGEVLDDKAFIDLATRLKESSVQTGIWVGPSGASALGGSAELLSVVDIVGVSVGSRVGETGPARLPASFGPAFGDATQRLETASISAPEAIELGITNVALDPNCPDIECELVQVSVLREFLPFFDGYQAPISEDATDTTGLSEPQFVGLSLTGQLFHTVAGVNMAYLLFVGGLALLVFELYTAGVGIAGMIGAACLTLGCYGLAVLPTRSWAIGLLIAAALAFAVDIQTNVPRLYSAIGMALFSGGTWFLFDGYRQSWVTILVGVVGAALYAYTGMPSMVRTRFSTPTIGRSWMIGEMGEAVSAVDPEGTVQVREAPWRAITNRATPIPAGEPVRVVGIHRMLLEVEPEHGAARDYRERG